MHKHQLIKKTALKIGIIGLSIFGGLFLFASAPVHQAQAACPSSVMSGHIYIDGAPMSGGLVFVWDMFGGMVSTTAASDGSYSIDLGTLATCPTTGDNLQISATDNINYVSSYNITYSGQPAFIMDLNVYTVAGPNIVSTNPADTSTGVATGTTVSVTFDRDMNTNNIDNTVFYLQDNVGNSVGAVVTYDQPSKTIIMTPSLPLVPNMVYTATLVSPVLTDVGTWPLAPAGSPNYTFSFTTAPDTTILTINPISAQTTTAGSPLNFTVSATGGSGSPVTFSATGLPSGASFNTSTGAFSWTPTGADVGTTMVTFDATDGTNVAASIVVSITVNAQGGGSCQSDIFSGTVYLDTLAIPGATVSFINNTQGGNTISTTSDSNGNYAIDMAGLSNCLAPGDQLVIMVADNTGNSSSYALSFIQQVSTTFDLYMYTGSPHVIATLPTDTSTNIATSTTIAVTFDHDMAGSAIDATNFLMTDAASNTVSGTFSYDQPTRTETFTPATNLADNTVYTVTLLPAFPDVSGSTLFSNYVFSFTTAPVATSSPSITIAEVTPVASHINNATPTYVFSSDGSGTITYGGDCSSTATSAVAGNNSITFNTLAEGLHNNCTITVNNGAVISNTLNISPFTVDLTPPVITILGNNPESILQNLVYSDAGAAALDNIDGNLTSSIITTNNVNTSIVGTSTVVYSVSDLAGNSASSTRTVIVSGAAAITPGIVTANPAAGVFHTVLDVALSSASSTSIRYTTDGTDPTCSVGTLYASPIHLVSSATIKAIGCNATSSSAVGQFVYNIALELNPTDLGQLFTDHIFQEASGTSITSTPSVTVTQPVIIDMPSTGGTSTVSIPAGTIITKIGGGSFDETLISAGDENPALLSGFGSGTVVDGALHWGITNLGLTFSQPIQISIFVGNSHNGETLNISRSISSNAGWTSDGISPTTCVVTSGLCSFTATKASYYTASHIGSSSSGSTSGGGGGSSFSGHSFITPASGLMLLINNGASQTSDQHVTLTINGGSDAVNMAISNNSNFSGASQQPVTSPVTWVLDDGSGSKTVYVKFYNSYGLDSPTISASIYLSPNSSDHNNESAIDTSSQGEQKVLGVKIYNYAKNLRSGSKGDDIKALQNFLIGKNLGPAAKRLTKVGATGYFGQLTKSALIEYQKKVGIKPATGSLDSNTRKYLNANQ